MEYERFTENKTGELRRFQHSSSGREDWLFVPNSLPPNWYFPAQLWPLLVAAKEALGTLNGIGQTLPNPQLLLRPLQTREAISSSSIEGTYVTPEQLLLYELDPREPTSAEGEVADRREVLNYAVALDQGCRLLEKLPICGRVIREMHKTLMSGVRGEKKSPGQYRRVQVQLGASGKYIPPPPGDVEGLMGQLESYINRKDDRYDPLVAAFLIHYQFEAIHPFSDGNGRVGRALLALMIYKGLGHTFPWLYMSPFFEKYRREYTDNMFRVSTHGDWVQWIEYCLRGAATQARDAIRRCAQFNELRTSYHDRVQKPTRRTHKIIDRLFTTPVVTIPSIAEFFDITYHTARGDIERLAKDGILFELENDYPRAFYARELVRLAFDNEETEAGEEINGATRWFYQE